MRPLRACSVEGYGLGPDPGNKEQHPKEVGEAQHGMEDGCKSDGLDIDRIGKGRA